MSEFGDWDPQDSFAPDNDPDPFQVARRIHELRSELEELAGRGAFPTWDKLDEDERDVAVSIGVELTKHLLSKGRDGSALAVHEARRYLGALPEWRDLGADEQQVALEMGDYIVAWLQREGTVIA